MYGQHYVRQRMSTVKPKPSVAGTLAILIALAGFLFALRSWNGHVLEHDGAPQAERYLLEVPQDHPAYTTAFRLLRLLDRFVAIYPDHVPPTSILRAQQSAERGRLNTAWKQASREATGEDEQAGGTDRVEKDRKDEPHGTIVHEISKKLK